MSSVTSQDAKFASNVFVVRQDACWLTHQPPIRRPSHAHGAHVHLNSHDSTQGRHASHRVQPPATSALRVLEEKLAPPFVLRLSDLHGKRNLFDSVIPTCRPHLGRNSIGVAKQLLNGREHCALGFEQDHVWTLFFEQLPHSALRARVSQVPTGSEI